MEYSIEASPFAEGFVTYCFMITDAGIPSALSDTGFPEARVMTGGTPVDFPNDNGNVNANENANVPLAALNIPGRPILYPVSPTDIRLVIAPNGNAAATQFWIQDSITDKYVQVDGSLGTEPVIKTFVDWGGGEGIVIKVTPNTRYKFRVAARPGI